MEKKRVLYFEKQPKLKRKAREGREKQEAQQSKGMRSGVGEVRKRDGRWSGLTEGRASGR